MNTLELPKRGDWLFLCKEDGTIDNYVSTLVETFKYVGERKFIITDCYGNPFLAIRFPELDTDNYNAWLEILT